jgi:glutathione S-transferase
MKLYDTKQAPNPRRVRIFLAEKGIEVPLVPVDLASAQNRQPEFLKKNPMGQVPVLELDDGTLIAETVAISRYFEQQKPEPPLMGVDPLDRVVVEMWQRRMEFKLWTNVGSAFRNTHAFFKGRIEQVPEYGEVCRKAAIDALPWLDAELAGREFIAGARYTIADITALVSLDFGRVLGIKIPPELGNLSRWYAAVSSRPSAGA